MHTVATKPDRLRDALLIVQILLIGLLVVSLTLGAIMERETPLADPPTPTQTPTQPEPSTASTLAPTSASGTATREELLVETSTPTTLPSPTETPLREPITRTGIGDSVFYPQKWVGPAVVRISFAGKGPLTVWTQNDNGEREDQLTNSVGPYHGSSLIDLFGSQRILRFEVRTSEAWQIDVMPLSAALHVALPGAIQGVDDDVVVLQGPYSPDLLTVDAPTAAGDISVFAFGSQRVQVIGTSGPYAGTVSIPHDTTVLVVRSTGSWRLEITTR